MRGSSLRLSAWPTHFSLASTVLMPGPPRRGPHGLDDVVVARAAAEVAGERLADLLLARVRVLGQQVRPRHDHPRRAVAALEPVVLPERLLERVQAALGAEAFDGGDLRPVGLHREHRAALHGVAVEMD